MKAILRLAVVVMLLIAVFGATHHKSDAADRLPGVAMISADRDQIRDGGVLRLAQSVYPRNFNFHQYDALTVLQIQESVFLHLRWKRKPGPE